jgi:hypothetical protein
VQRAPFPGALIFCLVQNDLTCCAEFLANPQLMQPKRNLQLGRIKVVLHDDIDGVLEELNNAIKRDPKSDFNIKVHITPYLVS